MFYRKEGFPEEDELVLCTVMKIQFHSVFVNLDEYDKQGMIHISEVSPGRIRNIRDFVKEGKKVVCKVLRVNLEKGHIDLSLRRVSESQRRIKNNWIKLEQKAEKIIEQIAKKLNRGFEDLYDEIAEKVFKKYPSIHECFENVVAGNITLAKLGIDAKISKELSVIIEQRFKPAEVTIKGHFKIINYAPNGVEIIKEILKKAEDTDKSIEIMYLGAGKYGMEITSSDYKSAEKLMKKAIDSSWDFAEKQGCKAEFVREEK